MKRVAHLGQNIDTLVACDLCGFLQIQSGAENAAIGRSQNGHTNAVIRLDLFPSIGQPVRRRHGKRVFTFGPVDTDGRNSVFDLHVNGAHDTCFAFSGQSNCGKLPRDMSAAGKLCLIRR